MHYMSAYSVWPDLTVSFLRLNMLTSMEFVQVCFDLMLNLASYLYRKKKIPKCEFKQFTKIFFFLHINLILVS